MAEVADYTALIAPEHASAPKFTATVAASVEPFVDVGTTAEGLADAFDFDTAVGAQEDVVGQWIGRSRRVPVPLEGLFFTWDDPTRGWDRGIWQGPLDTGVGITNLDDTTYRKLLTAKRLANNWDGTTPGAQAILDAYFTDPATFVFIEDDGNCALQNNFFSWDDPARGWDTGIWTDGTALPSNIPAADPSFSVVVSGKQPSILDLALLGADLIAAKPATVRLTYAVASIDNTPAFGFDVSNQYIAGWDAASWTVSPEYVITNPPIVQPPRANTGPVFGFDFDDDLIAGWDRGYWPLYDDIVVSEPA